MKLSPKVIGALIGFVVALLFATLHWRFVLLALGLSFLGYLIGLDQETGNQVRRKIKEFLSLLFD